MGPADLAALLADIPFSDDPAILVGTGTHDDAGVVLVRPGLAVVQTIDVFGPVVDDPYVYGQIAAANALSDLYAMGVTPMTALAFAGFPATLPVEVAASILRGGADKVQEAGAFLIGGHTIRDKEPKYGLAVTGFASPDEVLTNGGAQPGDVLFLTKPLGSGIFTSALKSGALEPPDVDRVSAVMATLNRGAARAARAAGAHAATDVTGFGLLGHLGELCRASGVQAELSWESVPVLKGTERLLADGCFPGGSRRNLEYASKSCAFFPGAPDHVGQILADAQTSGGLLVAVPAEHETVMIEALAREEEVPVACRIGQLLPREPTEALITVK